MVIISLSLLCPETWRIDITGEISTGDVAGGVCNRVTFVNNSCNVIFTRVRSEEASSWPLPLF